jgi:hypothetical protein
MRSAPATYDLGRQRGPPTARGSGTGSLCGDAEKPGDCRAVCECPTIDPDGDCGAEVLPRHGVAQDGDDGDHSDGLADNGRSTRKTRHACICLRLVLCSLQPPPHTTRAAECTATSAMGTPGRLTSRRRSAAVSWMVNSHFEFQSIIFYRIVFLHFPLLAATAPRERPGHLRHNDSKCVELAKEHPRQAAADDLPKTADRSHGVLPRHGCSTDPDIDIQAAGPGSDTHIHTHI